METISPAPDDTVNANPRSVKSDDSTPPPESGRGSPPPKCAICLGTCRNKSFTDSCLHQFCFACLLTWSKVKAECPLCKQVFKSIIHNVRSNHQYEEYMVDQRPAIPDNIFNLVDNLDNYTPRRFRYRTTLTLPLRDSMVFEHFLQQHQLGQLSSSANMPMPRSVYSPTSFRRTVYRHNLWARPLPDFTGRFRDCTPEFYRRNDAQMHRLVPWLTRELNYLLNENIPHMEYVLSRIMDLLREYPINSTEFRNAVQCYFGDNTEHFLHELYCFASTPYDITGFDRHVQYSTDPRTSTAVNEVLSSSESDRSVDSDIVEVTTHPAPIAAPPTAGPSRAVSGLPAYPPHYVVPIETISHSDTDDDDVLVVGYIKPPEQRTPEVVDLLGSDSDVVVQDAVAPAAEPATATAAATPLVKIRVKHTAPPLSPDSDSDRGGAVNRRLYPGRFRRRRRSQRTSSAEYRQTTSTSSTSSSSICSTSSSSDDSSTSSSSDSEPAPKKRKPTKTKKTSRPLLPSKDKTRTNKKTESTRNKNKDSERKKEKKSTSSTQTNAHRKDKKLKRRSRSKKDSKSSKKSKSNKKEPPNEQHPDVKVDPTPLEELARDQPSTSGTQNNSNTSLDATNSPQNKRDDSRERKRLKSVVKVMNKNRSDSSDNTPLNLLDVVSSAILDPKSNILTHNSDNSVTSDKKTTNKARNNVKTTESSNWSNASNCDSDSDTPLNLTFGSS